MKTGLRKTLSGLAMCLLLGATLAACGTQSDKAEPTATREDVAGAPPTRTATTAEDDTAGGDAGTEATPVETPAGGDAAPGGDAPSGGSTAIEVDMVDLAFEPTELTIAADTDVTITLVNNGNLPHAFAVPDQGIASDEVAGGASGEIVVNLPAGEYEFDCPIPGHKDAGMVGKLTVVAGGAATGSGTTDTAAETTDTAGETTDTAPAAGAPVEVDMVDLAFEPTEITIAANTDVTLNLVNNGNLPHAFAVPDQSIQSDEIAGGGTGSVVVNLPPGEYEFDCPIPGHKDAGMVGKLIVQ